MTLNTGPSILAAGVAGLIANALVAAMTVEGTGLFTLLGEPLRWVAAIAVASLLPLIFARMARPLAWIASLFALTMITALLSKLAFDARPPFGSIVAFHAVYAIVAIATYRTLVRKG